MKIKLFLLVLLICLSTAAFAEDNSLWSDEAQNLYQDLYKDEVETPREFEVGDVITVVIEEDIDAAQSANTQTGRDSSVDAGPGLGLLDFIQLLGFGYSDESSANGQVSRKGKLRASITTTVDSKTSAGNLKIVGTKKLMVNEEQQIIKMSGIIRPDDISEENTISSKNVADASIEFTGKGVVAEKQKPGFLEKLFNWIF